MRAIVRDGDRKFLDDLVQKQKQDEVLAGNSLSDAVQNGITKIAQRYACA